ncbi:MAG: tandem-95 repeat protein, partial [Actinomycetia bacterium]|nr:tandem-95 repeat protein [Actinomycetes bacterium]
SSTPGKAQSKEEEESHQRTQASKKNTGNKTENREIAQEDTVQGESIAPVTVEPEPEPLTETPNDQTPATISGEGGTVIEDRSDSLSGSLSITDINPGESSFISETQSGIYGTFSIDTEGSWSYSLANEQSNVQQLGNNENVTETFTINSIDGTSHHLTLIVQGTNDVPTLEVATTATVDEDGSTSINFKASDVDGTIDSTTTEATNGTATVNDDGTITYAPKENFHGEDTVTVTTKDDDGATVTQTIKVNVSDVNDAPTLEVESTATVDEDGSTSINFKATDIDGTIDSTEATSLNGTATVNNDGTITYEPKDNFHGEDTLTVTTTDDDGSTVTQTVKVNVSDVNDAPTLEVQSTATVDEDGSTSINFKTSDVDGTIDSTEATSLNGTATVNDDGTITYEPKENFHGEDTVTVTVKDDDGATTTQTIKVNVSDVNDAPTLEVQSTATVDENGSTSINFKATDVDGAIASTTAQAANGTIKVNDDGTITYVPKKNFHGEDNLTVTTTDDDGATITQTVKVNVSDVNDPPIINNDNIGSVDEDTTLTIQAKTLISNDTDIDGTTITITDVSADVVDSEGTVVGKAEQDSDGNIIFTPGNALDTLADGETKEVSFSYTARDGQGGTDTATVTLSVEGTDDAPVISGTTTGSVTEDAGDVLSTSGTLTIEDADAGQS